MLFRLRQQLLYLHFARRTRAVWSSPPIACVPSAGCEIHTMLGADDLGLYLVAIKSFLHFYPSVQVVVHSDGTLTADATHTLEHHVPNCRIVDRAEADRHAALTLGAGSVLHEWRASYSSARRLIDSELWSRTSKRIIMDSDVLVIRKPVEVIDWILNGRRPFLLGQAPVPSASIAAPPATSTAVQDRFRAKLDAISDRLGTPPTFLHGATAGFYGCSNELAFARIERLLTACRELGLPMTTWGSEQCVVIYLLSSAGATRLAPPRHVNFGPRYFDAPEQADIVHFYGTYRFHRGIYSRLAAGVVERLGAA
jgi:hypothetical protein